MVFAFLTPLSTQSFICSASVVKLAQLVLLSAKFILFGVSIIAASKVAQLVMVVPTGVGEATKKGIEINRMSCGYSSVLAVAINLKSLLLMVQGFWLYPAPTETVVGAPLLTIKSKVSVIEAELIFPEIVRPCGIILLGNISVISIEDIGLLSVFKSCSEYTPKQPSTGLEIETDFISIEFPTGGGNTSTAITFAVVVAIPFIIGSPTGVPLRATVLVITSPF